MNGAWCDSPERRGVFHFYPERAHSYAPALKVTALCGLREPRRSRRNPNEPHVLEAYCPVCSRVQAT